MLRAQRSIGSGVPRIWFPKSAYERWVGGEPDPRDLLTSFPVDLMMMWPVSTRVNSPDPDNDNSSLLDPAA